MTPDDPYIEEDEPGEIVPRFGDYSPYEMRLFKRRLNDLKRAYKEFSAAKRKDRTKEWPFYLNQSNLITVVFLYLNDLKEFKTFHDPKKGINNLKRAAYLSRWISNIRPIQHVNNYDLNNPELALLNEEYAIKVFLLYLGVGSRTIRSEIVAAVAEELKYIFRFRDPQRELLVSLARATQIALKSAA
jgi:hypothetical protein